MSDENLLNETVNPASLTNRQRGNLAELAFMRKAASLGLSVAKPWGEGERYDIIVRVENVCWRVQVKSVLNKSPAKPHYRIKTSTGGGAHSRIILYSSKEIDFLAAYIIPEDSWYIFPATVIEPRKIMCITPGSKRSKFEKYREAWKLMKPAAAASETEAPAASDSAIGSPAVATAKAGSI
jgi:hypothetical protein